MTLLSLLGFLTELKNPLLSFLWQWVFQSLLHDKQSMAMPTSIESNTWCIFFFDKYYSYLCCW